MANYNTKKLSGSDLIEFVGQIIEAFEDFLEEKGIDIDNCEKDESDGACIIYGTDYGFLQEDIEEILVNWGLAELEKRTGTLDI